MELKKKIERIVCTAVVSLPLLYAACKPLEPHTYVFSVDTDDNGAAEEYALRDKKLYVVDREAKSFAELDAKPLANLLEWVVRYRIPAEASSGKFSFTANCVRPMMAASELCDQVGAQLSSNRLWLNEREREVISNVAYTRLEEYLMRDWTFK